MPKAVSVLHEASQIFCFLSRREQLFMQEAPHHRTRLQQQQFLEFEDAVHSGQIVTKRPELSEDHELPAGHRVVASDAADVARPEERHHAALRNPCGVDLAKSTLNRLSGLRILQ